MRPSVRVCVGMLVLACAGGLVLAQDAVPDSLRDAFERLPAQQKDAVQRHAATLQAMTVTQRQAFEQRLAQWQALPDAERREQRERFQAWQALSPGEQAQLQAAAAQFAALPVDQQLELKQQYAQLDERQRHGWLLGPALGANWDRWQPLLMHVMPEQRQPLLTALRALTPQQRIDLGVLAQRTPPQSRDALRQAFLAQAPAQRGAWLVNQLER